MPVPNTFANATATIPLSQLDANFATTITLGNTAIQLGNTVSTLNNMTLANVTVTSGNVTLTNVTVTTANVTNATITTANVTTANIATEVVTTSQTLSYGAANGIVYLNGSKVSTTGASLTFDGTNFATTGSVTSAGASNSGNLAFTGTSNRITGDFSNATIANRVLFQTSTTNGASVVGVIPNGTGTISQLAVYGGSDPANAQVFRFDNRGGTESRIESTYAGTPTSGTYLPMTFYTGGSERMRLDTSGNLGIGTTSPVYKLDVVGAGQFSGTSADTRLLLTATGVANTVIGFNDSGSTNFAGAPTGAAYLSCAQAYPLVFGTSATERMRIDSSGILFVGKTATTNDVTTAGGFIQPSGKTVLTTTGTDQPLVLARNNNTGAMIEFYYGGSVRGSVSTNGTNIAYNTSSDYRLKENIAPMTGALSKVVALKPCTYQWKVDGLDGEGFIAHELAEICPGAVTGEKDGEEMQGVDYGKITPLLTAALQEAIAEIKLLKARVAELEEK